MGWILYKVKEVKVVEVIGKYTARGRYIVVLLEVTNTSKMSKKVGSQFFKAKDSQDHIFDMDTDSSLEYYFINSLNLSHYEELGPSLTDVLPIVFDVPKDAINIVLITEELDTTPILIVDELE